MLGKQTRGKQRMRWLKGMNLGNGYELNGHELGQTPGDSEGQRGLCAAVHGVTKSQTWLSNWTTTNTSIPRDFDCINTKCGPRIGGIKATQGHSSVQQGVKPLGLHYSKSSTIYLLLSLSFQTTSLQSSQNILFSRPQFSPYYSLLNIDIDMDTGMEINIEGGK